MKAGTGGTALLARRTIGLAVVQSAIAMAAPADGWSADAGAEIVEKDDEAGAPALALACVDVLLAVLNTDTLVLMLFTFETGDGSMKTGGCSDDWPSTELGLGLLAAVVTGVTGEPGGGGASSRPSAPARARSKAACG